MKHQETRRRVSLTPPTPPGFPFWVDVNSGGGGGNTDSDTRNMSVHPPNPPLTALHAITYIFNFCQKLFCSTAADMPMKDELTRRDKLALLDKLGLKPSKNFGRTREKVWRPNTNSYWSVVVKRSTAPDVSERGLRSMKALAHQRNRARRK